MRVLLCVFFFCAGASAAPTVPLNFTVTPAYIDGICSKLQDAKYKQFFPDWFVQPLCSMSSEGKQQMATYINDFHACKYPVPHTRDAAISQVKQYAPIAGEALEKTVKEGISRWEKLNKGAGDFVAKWEKKAYQNLDCDRLTMFVNVLSDGKDFIGDVNDLTPEDVQSLKAQFPEFVDAWDNMPNAKASRAMLEKLPDGFDFRGDPDTMNQLFNMLLADFVPKTAAPEN